MTAPFPWTPVVAGETVSGADWAAEAAAPILGMPKRVRAVFRKASTRVGTAGWCEVPPPPEPTDRARMALKEEAGDGGGDD